MGCGALTRADEDEVCAMYMRNLLEGRDTDPEAIRSMIMASSEAMKYGDPALPHLPSEDRHIALQVNCFDFAIAVSREDDLLVACAVGRTGTGQPHAPWTRIHPDNSAAVRGPGVARRGPNA
jgi:hypothetical protein